MADPYVSAKFKLAATVYDSSDAVIGTLTDVVSMSASFALNTIPTATLLLAVGYNPVTNKPASIHELKAKLRPRQRVVVELTITAGNGAVDKVAAGTYTVFDGFIAGIGCQRAHNQFNYVLNLVHWLDDLNNSSAINGNWFPGCPQDYAQEARSIRYGSAGGQSNGTVPGFVSTLFLPNQISSDLWGNAIKPLFNILAGFAAGGEQAETPLGPEWLHRNDAAKKALDKMPGDGAAYYPTGLPMLLTTDAAANIQQSMQKYFDNSIGANGGQTSFWGKLIADYGPQFLFAISPSVNWAIPIPFCPGLQWKLGGKTIKISDYNYANFNTNMTQIIESVNIMFPLDSKTGLRRVTSDPAAPMDYTYLVQYPNENTVKANAELQRGLKLFKNPPAWYGQMSAAEITAGASALGGGTAADPEAGTPPPDDPAAPVPAPEAYKAHESTLLAFAQHWYTNEVLQQRYGELSGPLRFDIAPGTIVKIELPRPKPHVNTNSTDPDEYLIASIMSVSFVINAERATAGTSFAIAHTKTEAENASAYYTFSEPPLYPDGKWTGAPLAVPR